MSQPCLHRGASVGGVKIACRPARHALAFACDLYGRCLPSVRLEDAALDKWEQRPESELYVLCRGCERRVAP